jgi:hypothetical protein
MADDIAGIAWEHVMLPLSAPTTFLATRQYNVKGDALLRADNYSTWKKKEEPMKRKATYRLMVTRREMLYVHDEFDHTLSLVEMEGEPIEYQVGIAGQFVSRRSVTYHDRIRGTGPTSGYAITTFQDGAIYTSYEGHRDGSTKLTKGTWKVNKGTGKLTTMKGTGTFTVKAGQIPREFILDIEGEYEL